MDATRGGTDRARTRRAAGGDEQCLFFAARGAFASSRGECNTHRRIADNLAPPDITTGEAWFKPVDTVQRLFPDHPELLQATLNIAERCDLKLELGKPILPEFNVPKNS